MGRDAKTHLEISVAFSFNPRAHVGRDRQWKAPSPPRTCFNPRAHVGRDKDTLGRNLGLIEFQSTRPRGARHSRRGAHTAPVKFQSTRPRGARLHAVEDVGLWIGVSIHAPTWGATCCCAAREFTHGVSIHAPTWGATHQRRGDYHQRRVSIHAPTWGATKVGFFKKIFHRFQSTRPRGARLELRKRHVEDKRGFNPRAHVGRDSQILHR